MALESMACLFVRAAMLLLAACPTPGALKLERSAATSAGPVYRQTMINYKDLQYYGNVTVGTQELHAVLDTGSIEFVVISDRCVYWCGKESALFHANKSASYRSGATSLVLSYGSGQLMATEAYETIKVGPINVTSAPFWEVVDANMPLLFDSDFEAIVGLGPIPPDTNVMEPGSRQNEDSSAVLLKKFQIDRFSICLGKDPGSPGFFTWNDDSIGHAAFHFQQVNIPDTGYWMAPLSDVRLGQKLIACEHGCGAVVDSGTSLLALPETAYATLEAAVEALNYNCQDLASLPDIRFKLNGVQFSLPADSYIGQIVGEVSESVSGHFKFSGSARKSEKKHEENAAGEEKSCEVALMHISMDSTLGQVWILGTPFFRKYYSVFVQGTVERSPMLYTTLATEECKPATSAKEGLLGSPSHKLARKIDAGGLRMPPWLHRASHVGKLEEKLRLKGRQVIKGLEHQGLHR